MVKFAHFVTLPLGDINYKIAKSSSVDVPTYGNRNKVLAIYDCRGRKHAPEVEPWHSVMSQYV